MSVILKFKKCITDQVKEKCANKLESCARSPENTLASITFLGDLVIAVAFLDGLSTGAAIMVGFFRLNICLLRIASGRHEGSVAAFLDLMRSSRNRSSNLP